MITISYHVHVVVFYSYLGDWMLVAEPRVCHILSSPATICFAIVLFQESEPRLNSRHFLHPLKKHAVVVIIPYLGSGKIGSEKLPGGDQG